ncbi:MAG: U32 family peptidase [Bacteroidales bacterium]|nr:U32 family peptidase [Bacteroidales bacterium]MDD4671784.1 U32 family peptidase [Bacteroidales bacterium]MDY0347356.1 U32 family peptidase [Tenuifilaceae bacterium]
MQRAIELLCPAKDVETGIAAINHGADAVYIGYKKFGARNAAGNSLADIERLTQYAHLFFAKVFVTINTILYESELENVQKLIHQLYNIGVDAIIIQDMGILEMDLPPIPLHASTQTHNITAEKLKFLQSVGIQRVILARELSLREISTIRSTSDVEIEAFIHGALCVCYSGQCYLSHFLTGRSANRGECAQPCRSKYDLIDENGKILAKDKHLLSLKDFNQSQNIEQLIEAGVSSFKIEGRLKDISYVKNNTAHYRQILDNIIKNSKSLTKPSSGSCSYNFTPNPEKTFNRGYTQYFAKGRSKNMASFNTPKSTGQPLGKIIECNGSFIVINTAEEVNNNDGLCFFDQNNKLVGIKVNKVVGSKIYPNHPLSVKLGTSMFRNFDHKFEQQLLSNKSGTRTIDCKIEIKITDSSIELLLTDEDNVATHSSFNFEPELAKNPKGMLLTLKSQVEKTGNTVYKISNIKMQTNTHVPFFKLKHINAWRRELLEAHNRNRLNAYTREARATPTKAENYPDTVLDHTANISNTQAENFYQKHGATKTAPCFELTSNNQNKTLMTTRYCMLFEMGVCNGKGETIKEKLFLMDNLHKYELVFDCKKCEMKIKGGKKQFKITIVR